MSLVLAVKMYKLDDHLPMSMCGENLAVGRTESMPLLSLSFSPLTGTWSLWMAAGWSCN